MSFNLLIERFLKIASLFLHFFCYLTLIQGDLITELIFLHVILLYRLLCHAVLLIAGSFTNEVSIEHLVKEGWNSCIENELCL